MFSRKRKGPMETIGHVGYRPGGYQLDPNHDYTTIPMSMLGDRVWQGVQKDNGVTGLLLAQNWLGRNPYQTTLEKTDRVQLSNGGPLAHNSMGPALYNDLLIRAGV